jgi:hypothetical protein
MKSNYPSGAAASLTGLSPVHPLCKLFTLARVNAYANRLKANGQYAEFQEFREARFAALARLSHHNETN